MKDLRWFDSLSHALTDLEGQDVTILKDRAVTGGCICSSSVLTLSTGRLVFMKKTGSPSRDMFLKEAAGLEALRKAVEGPAVPSILAVGSNGDEKFLLMEYIEGGEELHDFWEDFGRSLARLHKLTRNRQCGFEHDNSIGASPQYNGFMDGWIDFFRIRRLEPQLKTARDKDLADATLAAKVINVMNRLEHILQPCGTGGASLLHGDLWSGNFKTGPDGRAWVFDPAVYYGHREADLAMTELFGGFSQEFYRAYNQEWPLDPGYSQRRDVYNLYHMLNHLNLFGSSYAGSVLSIASRYA